RGPGWVSPAPADAPAATTGVCGGLRGCGGEGGAPSREWPDPIACRALRAAVQAAVRRIPCAPAACAPAVRRSATRDAACRAVEPHLDAGPGGAGERLHLTGYLPHHPQAV